MSSTKSRTYFVYLMSSISGTLYVGMTDSLVRRVADHKLGIVEGFTKKYSVNRLVYFECFTNAYDASTREKQIKKFRRDKKIQLFSDSNPDWRDLSEEIRKAIGIPHRRFAQVRNIKQ
jgi:putative endonuclease